jgi:tRNA(Arg) A34 adenosine deaminase TadA
MATTPPTTLPPIDIYPEGEGNAMPSHLHDVALGVLVAAVSASLAREVLARATMYTSAEPCAMCSGATYWAGIGRVVYGLSERRLKELTGGHAENPTLDLPCRVVFAAGQRATHVVGPLLEDEGAALHAGAWW